MKSFTRAMFVAGAVLMGSAPSQAQGTLDAYMPGEMMGVEMSKTVFEAFFSDAEGKVARSADDFMKMYSKMDARDKAIVRVACSMADLAKAGFSDHVASACRAAGM